MTVLIINNIDKFPIKNSNGGFWQPLNNTITGDYWLQLNAQQDLDKAGISYTIGEVEIKEDIEQ